MQSKHKCPWCDKSFKSETSVVRHSSRIHLKGRYDYDLLIKHNDIIPKCGCGCGQDVEYSQHVNAFNRFVKNHQHNDVEIKKLMLDGSRKVQSDPDIKKRISQSVKKWWSEPKNADKAKKIIDRWFPALQKGHAVARKKKSYKDSLSHRLCNQWSNEWGIKMRDIFDTDEFRDKVSASVTEALASPDIREKLSKHAAKLQANGIIGPNMTKRSWMINPFIMKKEHLDSGWERLFLECAIDRNIAIVRNYDVFIQYEEGKNKRIYVPDFVSLSGRTLIEIKGMKTLTDELKLSAGELYCNKNNLAFVVFSSIKQIKYDNESWEKII